jgi:hypothetical protein
MATPEYAMNFILITSEVTATLLGFLVVFWIFWYENIGKKLPVDFGKRKIGYRWLKFYMKFERKFFIKFLIAKIPFPFIKIRYIDVFKKIKLLNLYGLLKKKTKNRWFRIEYKKVNYALIITISLFFVVILTGANFLHHTVAVQLATTNFTEEQLQNDTSLNIVLQRIFNDFEQFYTFFFITITLTIVQSVQILVKKMDISNET